MRAPWAARLPPRETSWAEKIKRQETNSKQDFFEQKPIYCLEYFHKKESSKRVLTARDQGQMDKTCCARIVKINDWVGFLVLVSGSVTEKRFNSKKLSNMSPKYRIGKCPHERCRDSRGPECEWSAREGWRNLHSACGQIQPVSPSSFKPGPVVW